MKVTFHRDATLTLEQQTAIAREVVTHLRKLHFPVEVIPLELDSDPAHDILLHEMVRDGMVTINIVNEE